MKIKFLSVIVSVLIVAFSVVSCLGTNESYDYTIDDTIYAFEIDTIYGVTYKFTIDQINNKIFNADSVPVSADTIINKILITKVQTTTGYVFTGDSLLVMTDSLDLSNTVAAYGGKPLELTVYSLDWSTNRKYEIEVRRHRQDPDSLTWSKKSDSFSGGAVTTASNQKAIQFKDQVLVYTSNETFYYAPVTNAGNWSVNNEVNLPGNLNLSSLIKYGSEDKEKLYIPTKEGKVFSSSDRISWEESPLSGNVVALITAFPEGIAGIVKDEEGVNRFALSDKDATSWEMGEIAPDDFPTENISSTYHTTNTGLLKYLIVGKPADSATQTVPWFSFDGKEWADLATTSNYYIPAMERPTIMYYANRLYVYGGDFKTFYTTENALVWKTVDKKFMFPEEFHDRGAHSTVVDDEGYIWIMWGKNTLGSETYNDEVWTGRLNKLGFIIQ